VRRPDRGFVRRGVKLAHVAQSALTDFTSHERRATIPNCARAAGTQSATAHTRGCWSLIDEA